MIGGEVIWGDLEFKDGSTQDDTRFQFSVKYNWGKTSDSAGSYNVKTRFLSIITAALATVALRRSRRRLLRAKATAPEPLSSAAIESALDAAYAQFKDLKEGANADYIPALAKVDPNIFGIALVTADGRVYTKGDVSSEVSIQSISKVFTMAKVIEEQGPAAIASNMGVDATGQVFNSINAVEQYKGAEMNAMVNPGAITTASMVSGGSREEIWNKILAYYSDFAGRPAERATRRSSSPRPTRTSATRRSRC